MSPRSASVEGLTVDLVEGLQQSGDSLDIVMPSSGQSFSADTASMVVDPAAPSGAIDLSSPSLSSGVAAFASSAILSSSNFWLLWLLWHFGLSLHVILLMHVCNRLGSRLALDRSGCPGTDDHLSSFVFCLPSAVLTDWLCGSAAATHDDRFLPGPRSCDVATCCDVSYSWQVETDWAPCPTQCGLAAAPMQREVVCVSENGATSCRDLLLSPDRALIFLVMTLLATKRPDRPVKLLFGMITRLSC